MYDYDLHLNGNDNNEMFILFNISNQYFRKVFSA